MDPSMSMHFIDQVVLDSSLVGDVWTSQLQVQTHSDSNKPMTTWLWQETPLNHFDVVSTYKSIEPFHFFCFELVVSYALSSATILGIHEPTQLFLLSMLDRVTILIFDELDISFSSLLHNAPSNTSSNGLFSSIFQIDT